MTTNFTIGDKVRLIAGNFKDKVGVIVDKGGPVYLGNLEHLLQLKSDIRFDFDGIELKWWKVKFGDLIEEIPEDQLENME